MRYLLHLLPALLLLTACTPIRDAQVVPGKPAPPVAPAPEAPPAEPQPEEPAAPALGDPIPFTEELQHGTLDNGLSYFVRPNAKPENRAELRLVVNAGSLQEDQDQQGLAHFVEHMAFNGTENFEKQELVDYLESIGSSFGADLNAYTGFDETVYQLTVPTDDEAILEKAFQILADWAGGVTFDPEEVDKERGILVEEWRLGRGAGARIRDRQIPIIFQDSRYAQRLPIGDLEIIEKAPAETLRRFYDDWYRPDLMAVVAVGDFEPETIRTLIKKHFDTLESPDSPRPRETYPVPPHEETLFSIETDPELSSTSLAVLYKHPATGEGTFGDYRRSLVERLYHGMLNDRLAELTQEADPPFLYAVSGQGAFARSSTVFSQQVRVRDDQVLRGLEALLTEVERVDLHGFTEGELERAKISTVRGYQQAAKERDKLNSSPLAQELVRHYLEGESVPGIDRELEIVERFLPTITLDEVNRLARQWITEENRVILLTGPETAQPLPGSQTLLASFEKVEKSQPEPYVDQTRDEPLLADIPEGSPVVEEKTLPEVGITEWRLGNGVRVVLKPTDFQNDEIRFTAWSPGGHSLVSDEDYTSALFATTLLAEGGLGDFDQIELGKHLTGVVASASVFLAELEEGASGGASPSDLETMFQLLYLRFTQPRYDADAFASLMSRLSILVKNRDSRPQTAYRDRLGEVLSQDHPRRQPISEETLEAIDPKKALAIYRDRFADASDFTFAFVGNFTPDDLRPLVETYLGGLPTTDRQETWRDIGVEHPPEPVRFEVRKGIEPKSRVDLLFHGSTPWSREGLHEIATLAQVLQIRLREVLREELGATYGVSVSGSLNRRPRETYSLSVGFGTAPDSVDELVETLLAELETVRDEGIDAERLAKVQETQRRRREVQLKENAFWLNALESYYRNGFDPRWLLDYESLVISTSPESLQAAARRYLDPARYVLGVHHPETGEGGEAPADSGAP